jgi:hypothetical protein
MKRSKKMMAIATGFCWFVIMSTATARVNPLDTLAYQLKSPGRAQGLSATCTIMPVAAGIMWASSGQDSDMTGPAILLMSGIMVGPSVGYFYGDCAERGAQGLVLRTGIIALTMAAGGFAADHGSDAAMSYDGMAAGLVVAAVGFGVITIHSLYDIGRVRSTVENRNRKLMGQHQQTSVTITPAYFADYDAAGMQLQIAF